MRHRMKQSNVPNPRRIARKGIMGGGGRGWGANYPRTNYDPPKPRSSGYTWDGRTEWEVSKAWSNLKVGEDVLVNNPHDAYDWISGMVVKLRDETAPKHSVEFAYPLIAVTYPTGEVFTIRVPNDKARMLVLRNDEQRAEARVTVQRTRNIGNERLRAGMPAKADEMSWRHEKYKGKEVIP